jgi:predicted transcriptional regulator
MLQSGRIRRATQGETVSIHQQKTIRFTLDMLPDLHRHLKIVCAEDGVSMHTFVTEAIEEKFEAREEKADALAYDEGIKEVADGKTHSLEDVQKELVL